MKKLGRNETMKNNNASDLQRKDTAKRSNLDTVSISSGSCRRSNEQECQVDLGQCITCRNLCATFKEEQDNDK